MNKNRKLCECGCGEYANPGRRFINGHNTKGKPISEKHRQKIALALKGKPKSDEHRQNIIKNHVGMTGKKHTDKTKQKMGENNIGMGGKKHTDKAKQKMHERMLGENNPNWQGGISFGKYCHLFNDKFKELIRKLYNRKCFLCDKTEKENGVKLSVHHVNYDKTCLCNSLCEFVPLCQSCHSKTSSNRKYWEDLIMNYLYPERYFMIDI